MSTAEEAPGGKIEQVRIARVLSRFWEQGFTGSFRARATVRPGAAVSKEIFFERGRVAWAASDDPEESIRVHLFNRGLLRPDQWRLAEEKAGSVQIRQTLLDLGFLTGRELHEADRDRMTAIVLSLFTWREGRYEIQPGPLPHGTPNLKLDPRDLVLEGLMSSGDRGQVLDEIGSLDAVLVVRPDDLVRASLSLPVEVVELMGKADGTRTIADICALSPLSDFMISAAFAGLKVLGLARPVDAAAAAPPAPPTPSPERPPVRRRSRDASPMLPLYDAGEYETAPVTATPPRGVPLQETAPASETVPMAATPPGGVPVQAAPAAAEEQRPERVDEPEAAVSVPEVFEEDDDSLTRRVAATPPHGIPTAAACDEDDVEREAEIELKPGIPVGPAEEPHEEEIDEAIQALDTPFPEDEGEASPIEQEATAEAESGDEAPPWVYEPSVDPAGARSGKRWAAWGGAAAALLGLGAGLAMMFGGGAGDGGAGALEAAPVAAGPADVRPPDAFADEAAAPRASAPPQVAAAAMSDPAKPSAVRPAAPPPSPAPRKGVKAREVARSGSRDIFASGSFEQGRRLLAAGDLAEAAGRFDAAIGGRKGLYTVQLALACESQTVQRAVGSARGSSDFFILPATYGGRPCYRLLWGAYPSRAAAAKAKDGVPASFLKDRRPPFVAPL